MDLNQLNTFHTLARTRNYTRCAEKLFVTQSAVSHAVRKLEKSLDQVLITRKGSDFQLSSQGKILFQACESIFSELSAAREKMRAMSGKPETLVVGSVMEFGATVLMKNMAPFLKAHPEIHLDFALVQDPLTPFVNDAVDLMIDCRDHANPSFMKTRLFREAYTVIASPDFLARNPVSGIPDLESVPILSMDRDGAWWSNFIHALPPEACLRFSRIIMINHVRGIINACLGGMGVGFVPRYTVLRELEQGALVSLFPGLSLLEDSFFIYVKRSHRALNRIEPLVRYIQSLAIE